MRTANLLSALAPVLALGLSLSASAAWYWPFDFDPDSTNKPPRLHRLLEKANEYIELAEDEALDGDGDKAIENYRLALKELDRVEAENPDRAESPEFAPLRNKRATCSAAIDAIRFAQVNENKRAVAVSNTTDLERKWRIKHGLQTLADEAFAKQEAAKTNAAAQASSPASAATNAPAGTARPPAAKTPPPAASYDVRLKEALAEVRKGDYATADHLLDGLEEERPDDLNLLLIRSAAQVGAGSLFAARRTLERAMKAHPKSYLPCYNLANLALRLNENLDVARDCYEQGRALGGPRNEALERRLNTK